MKYTLTNCIKFEIQYQSSTKHPSKMTNWDLYTAVSLIRSNNIQAARKHVQYLCSKYPSNYHELGIALHALTCENPDIACQMIMSLEDKGELQMAMIKKKADGEIGQAFWMALKSPVARKLF
jgi:hypothetical protein